MSSQWHIYKSLFVRLVIVNVLVVTLVNILLGLFFNYMIETNVDMPFLRRLASYINYLINDIGHPPSLEKATAISERTAFQIAFKGQNIGWTTHQGLEIPERIKYYDWHEQPRITIGRYKGKHYVIVRRRGGRFIFELNDPDFDKTTSKWEGISFAVVLSIIILVSFLIIGALLRPLKFLHAGVTEVSMGNFDYKVPVKGSTEIKGLALGFNFMTHRLNAMMQSKEQLLLDISHEMRSPLTRIKLALEFVRQYDIKEKIGADIMGMEKMVARILDSARIRNLDESLNLQQTYIIYLIKTVAAEFHTDQHKIVVNASTDAILKIDAEKISVVLRNIFDNAIKYSGEDSEPVYVTTLKDGDEFIINVRNSGNGIPESEIPLLFEPFYRVDKSRSNPKGGYGLGLSICKSIMDAHGGRIDIESVVSSGTTVSLIFRTQG